MTEKNKRHIQNIKENYKNYEEEIAGQLLYSWDNHQQTTGGYREEVWKSFFERIIPKKFKIERSVFIIDSFGNCSNEVDLAIYDEQFTPYMFNYGILKFIPIEAVAAVIECKSKSVTIEQLQGWTNEICKLKTSCNSVARIVDRIIWGENKNGAASEQIPGQTATRPIRILCWMPDKSKEDEKKDAAITKEKERFDIVMRAIQKKKGTSNELKIEFNNARNLFEWYTNLNHAMMEASQIIRIEDMVKGSKELKELTLEKDYVINEKKKKEEQNITLLSFIFQFNQLLMLINNPMFFPHRAYVQMFNGGTEEMEKILLHGVENTSV